MGQPGSRRTDEGLDDGSEGSLPRASTPGASTPPRPETGARRPGLPVAVAVLAALAAAPASAPAAAQSPEAGTSEGDSTATLVGTVVSAMTGGPLEGAQVFLDRSRNGAITDSTGHFRIPRVPAGFVDTVRVRLIGYATQSAPLRLTPGATTRAVISLSQKVLRVEELEVEVERSPLRSSLAEFERHRKTGNGFFVTPQMIEQQDPSYASDLLRRVPGVTVSGQVTGQAVIRFVHSSGNCYPNLYLNGTPWPRHNLDELSPSQILAMEVYRGTSEVPLRFHGPGREDCGVIVVWTRQGGAMDSIPSSGR